MHINKIKIENFKGISILEFKPKKINIIVGKNNTGKTSLLEGLYLLFNHDETKERYAKHLSNIINANSQKASLNAETDEGKKELSLEHAEYFELLKSFKKDLTDLYLKALRQTLKNTDTQFRDQLEKKISELVDTELKPSLFEQSIKTIEDKKNEKIDYHFEIGKSATTLKLLFDKVSDYIRTLNNDKRIRVYSDYIIFRLCGLTDSTTPQYTSELKEKKVIMIKNLLKQAREASQRNDKESVERLHETERIIKEYKLIDNLERLGFDYIIFEDSSGKKTIPFDFLGDGFKALVGMLWSLSSKEINNKVLLLDEPENYMHPGYVKELLRMIIMFADKLNIQFFIATHNRDLIELVFENEDRLSPEEQEYLKYNTTLLRMDKINNHTICEVLDFNDAKSACEDLLLDLRGI